MADDKIYVGRGKEKTFGDGGNNVTMSICLSDIPKEHIKKSDKNGKSYVTLIVGKLKNTDDYGNTHTVRVDTWKPTQKAAAPAPQEEEDELPF